MRALIYPTYSFPGKVLADSLYILARAVIRTRPDVHWYLPVPNWNDRWPKDDLDDTPWCTKFPVPMKTLYRTQEASIDPALLWRFCPQEGSPPVEFAIVMTPMRTLNIANAWAIRSPPMERPVLATWDLLARDDRHKEYHADEIELVHIAAGMAVSDLNLHEAPITEWMAKYNARRYLAPAYVKRVIDSSRLYELGIDWKRMHAQGEGKKRERFTVYYGGRFAESKRFGELAEIVDAAYRFGRDMDFVVCTGSLAGKVREKFGKRFPQVELHVGTNQEEAWAIQNECHAAVCFSRGEIFGMSFWEQLGGGLAVTMKTERWNEDMLPAEYPLRVMSAMDAGAKVRQLYEEWQVDPVAFEVEHGWDSKWAMYVRERYAPKNLIRMVDEVKTMALAKRDVQLKSLHRGSGPMMELVPEATEGYERIGWTDLIARIREVSRSARVVVGAKMEYPRSNSMMSLYRSMLANGWVDDVNETMPTFERKQDD